MRKTFEARMAHSANLVGNYIVVFGGYCIQSGSFSHPNFTVLSLLGCTDFMLPKACTIKSIIDSQRLLIDQKLEEDRRQMKEKAEKAEQAEREKAIRVSKKKQPLQSSFRDGHGKNEAMLPSIGSLQQMSFADRKTNANGAAMGHTTDSRHAAASGPDA